MVELRNWYDESEEGDYDDDLSYHLSQEQRAPVKFVSTTSTHNIFGNDSDFALEKSNSVVSSIVHESNEIDSLGSEDSFVKRRKSQRGNAGSDSESSSPAEFTAKDVADIRRYVESIEDAQQKIRKILSKIDSN